MSQKEGLGDNTAIFEMPGLSSFPFGSSLGYLELVS
jgi:hypothetical protein